MLERECHEAAVGRLTGEANDLRAQVARLKGEIDFLDRLGGGGALDMVMADNKRHTATLQSIRPLVRAVLAERAAEIELERALDEDDGSEGDYDAIGKAGDSERMATEERRAAADALPAEVREWAGEGEE